MANLTIYYILKMGNQINIYIALSLKSAIPSTTVLPGRIMIALVFQKNKIRWHGIICLRNGQSVLKNTVYDMVAVDHEYVVGMGRKEKC